MMIKLSLTILALVFAQFNSATPDLETASDVLELNADNFDTVVSANPVLFVEFYAPWCGHCKHLAPEYEKAATELKGRVPLAKVDADSATNKPLASRFEIQGFPTLKLFRNGKPTDYQGERSAEAIVSFLKRQVAPAVTTLSTTEDVDKFSKDDTIVLVGFFDNKDSDGYQKYKEIAEELRDKHMFGEVIGSPEIRKQFDVASTPSVVLFKSFEEGRNVYTSNHFNDFKDFIAKYSLPLLNEIGPHNYRQYAQSRVSLAYLFVDLTEDGQKDEYIQRVFSIAESTRGQLNWVYIDWSKYSKHAEKVGLSGKVVPSIAIEDFATEQHFSYDETAELTTEKISAWVDQFLNQQLKPTVRSDPIPESNEGPVKVVVANSFNDVVLNPNDDVFVEFYAPWCGHCKSLAPIWEQLAEKVKTLPNLVIAKMDATSNDVPPKYGIRGFPTLKLFPADAKLTPVDYNGDRSLDDLYQFVLQHSSSKTGGVGKDEL